MSEELDFSTRFNKIFKKYSKKHTKISLYGTGIITEYVLNNLKEKYSFINVLDYNSDKKEFCGFIVKNRENFVATDSEILIIMNRNPVITRNIYNRIIPDINTIKIFDINGKQLKPEKKKKEEIRFLSAEEIKNEINKHDVISFDFFDTLVTRKCSHPDDVKEFVSSYVKQKYQIDDYVEKRKISESLAEKKAHDSNIFDIYFELGNFYGENIAEDLLDKELETEKEFLIPRKDMIDIFYYAKQLGKKVYICSDMYLTFEQILEICNLNSISIEKENLWVSCEKKASKANGSLYKLLRKNNKGLKCLHIGDNQFADYNMAKKNKIDAILCPNPNFRADEVIKNLSLNNVYNKSIYGLSISHLYNSPFSKSIKSLEDFGYSILAPILLNWLLWIIEEIKSSKNNYIYFAARDGFFTVKLFNYLCETFGVKKEAIYLNVSRTFLSYISLLDDKGNVSGDVDFKGTEKEFLFYRFGIDSKETDDTSVNHYTNLNEGVLNSYKEIIKDDIDFQKDVYRNYLKEIHFLDDDKILFVDPSYRGTTQKMLSEFVQLPIQGYYCYADLSESNPNYNENMKSFFQDEYDKKAEKSILYIWHMLFESSIMVAPTGSLIKFDSNNCPIYTPLGKTQLQWDNKEKTYSGIKSFFEDFCQLYEKYDFELQLDKSLPLSLYEAVVKNDLLDESIKKTFYMDSFYENVHDTPIF